MTPPSPDALRITDLGRIDYVAALAIQRERVEAVIAARESESSRAIGEILLVEHDPPVITITPRPAAATHLIADAPTLARQGVQVAQTDRGGDITYHGPGQLVVYPIIDLNALGMKLHAYMRLLEEAAILTCAHSGVTAKRDPGATGVWVNSADPARPAAKICALGVRVRRWVTSHGLAINVTTNLKHFDLIVPCGLAGRPVTSFEALLGPSCPTMAQVKTAMTGALTDLLTKARRATPASDPDAHPQ